MSSSASGIGHKSQFDCSVHEDGSMPAGNRSATKNADTFERGKPYSSSPCGDIMRYRERALAVGHEEDNPYLEQLADTIQSLKSKLESSGSHSDSTAAVCSEIRSLINGCFSRGCPPRARGELQRLCHLFDSIRNPCMHVASIPLLYDLWELSLASLKLDPAIPPFLIEGDALKQCRLLSKGFNRNINAKFEQANGLFRGFILKCSSTVDNGRGTNTLLTDLSDEFHRSANFFALKSLTYSRCLCQRSLELEDKKELLLRLKNMDSGEYYYGMLEIAIKARGIPWIIYPNKAVGRLGEQHKAMICSYERQLSTLQREVAPWLIQAFLMRKSAIESVKNKLFKVKMELERRRKQLADMKVDCDLKTNKSKESFFNLRRELMAQLWPLIETLHYQPEDESE